MRKISTLTFFWLTLALVLGSSLAAMAQLPPGNGPQHHLLLCANHDV